MPHTHAPPPYFHQEGEEPQGCQTVLVKALRVTLDGTLGARSYDLQGGVENSAAAAVSLEAARLLERRVTERQPLSFPHLYDISRGEII